MTKGVTHKKVLTYLDILAEPEVEADYREYSYSSFIIDLCYSNDDVEGLWDSSDIRHTEILQLRKLTEKLSKADRELYQMIYIDQLTQSSVAKILNVSQPIINQRVTNLTSKLIFLNNLPDCKEVIAEELPKLSPTARKYVELYISIPNQKIVADTFNVSKAAVSIQVKKTIENNNLSDAFRNYLRILIKSPNDLVLG
jgi:predicted XRE-type DNA-binding protein